MWQRYKAAQQITPAIEPVVSQDYHTERGGKIPRYYQRIAINRTVEAIAKGQDRIGVKERILFLADRSIALVDHALRRRFHFIRMQPNADILRAFFEATDNLEMTWVANLLEQANENLAKDGIDWHLQLGHSHFMRHPFTEPQLRMIWEHTIIPTLEEYFYRQPTELKEYKLQALKDALGASK